MFIYHAKEVKLISALWFDDVYFEQEPGPNFTSRGLSDLGEGLKNGQPLGRRRRRGLEARLPNLHPEQVGRCESGRNVQTTRFPSENASANLQP